MKNESVPAANTASLLREGPRRLSRTTWAGRRAGAAQQEGTPAAGTCMIHRATPALRRKLRGANTKQASLHRCRPCAGRAPSAGGRILID